MIPFPDRQLFFWFLACLFFPQLTHSQKLKSSDTLNLFDNEYKFDLSIDGYNLFRKGIPNMMLRYAPNKKGAMRLRLGGKIESTKYSGAITVGGPYFNFGTVNNYLLDISLGYEFHKNKKRFQLFGGPEVSVLRSYGKFTYDPSYNGPKVSDPNYLQIVGSGFIGVKYFVLKRLSLSSESRLYYQRDMLKVYDGNNIVSKVSSNRLLFDNLRALNISLHF